MDIRNWILIVVILLGGCSAFNSDSLPENEETIIKQAESRTIEYVKRNYKEVDTLEISSHAFSPIGTVFISGQVNDDKHFTLNLNYEDDYNVVGFSHDTLFLELKDECKKKVC